MAKSYTLLVLNVTMLQSYIVTYTLRGLPSGHRCLRLRARELTARPERGNGCTLSGLLQGLR